jgi:hypothetical protein
MRAAVVAAESTNRRITEATMSEPLTDDELQAARALVDASTDPDMLSLVPRLLDEVRRLRARELTDAEREVLRGLRHDYDNAAVVDAVLDKLLGGGGK